MDAFFMVRDKSIPFHYFVLTIPIDFQVIESKDEVVDSSQGETT